MVPERAMAAMEEANHRNNKVGTSPGHVLGEDSRLGTS
jgi:hypothetical protein